MIDKNEMTQDPITMAIDALEEYQRGASVKHPDIHAKGVKALVALNALQSKPATYGLDKIRECIEGLSANVQVLLNVIENPDGGSPLAKMMIIEIAKNTIEESKNTLAILDQQAITTTPSGWKLAPVEPTQEMVDAALSKQDIYTGRGSLARIGYQAMLSAAPQAPVHGSWQPIETAPKDGTEILICDARTATILVAAWNGDDPNTPTHKWECLDVAYHEDLPTHWMPLPAAPQPELRGEG